MTVYGYLRKKKHKEYKVSGRFLDSHLRFVSVSPESSQKLCFLPAYPGCREYQKESKQVEPQGSV